jgi:hypothetical protein
MVVIFLATLRAGATHGVAVCGLQVQLSMPYIFTSMMQCVSLLYWFSEYLHLLQRM